MFLVRYDIDQRERLFREREKPDGILCYKNHVAENTVGMI